MSKGARNTSSQTIREVVNLEVIIKREQGSKAALTYRAFRGVVQLLSDL